MDFDILKFTLESKYNSIPIPLHLKQKVLSNIGQKPTKDKFSFKRKVVIACLGAFLTVPPLSYVLLADQIYGSYESASKYGITQPEYLRFNTKLSQAAGILKPDEFKQFIVLSKDLIFFMIKYGDTSITDRNKFGQVDVTKLSPEKAKEYNELVEKIQPYFDKLNAANEDEVISTPNEGQNQLNNNPLYKYPNN